MRVKSNIHTPGAVDWLDALSDVEGSEKPGTVDKNSIGSISPHPWPQHGWGESPAFCIFHSPGRLSQQCKRARRVRFTER
jgi:hypothetical protein